MGLTDLVIYSECKLESVSDEYNYNTQQVFGVHARDMDCGELDIPNNVTLEELKKFIKDNTDKMCERDFVYFEGEFEKSKYINTSIILSLMLDFLYKTGNERVSYTFT